MQKGTTFSASPSRGSSALHVALAVALVTIGVMSATMFVLVERFVEADIQESTDDDSSGCDTTTAVVLPPPPPVSYPSAQYCARMVEYTVRYGLNNHPSIPDSIRGEQYTVENVCVPIRGNRTEFAEMGISTTTEASLRNFVAGRQAGNQAGRQAAAIDVACSVGQFAWNIANAGDDMVTNPPSLSVLPGGANAYFGDFEGWETRYSGVMGWNLEASWVGQGAEFSFMIEFQYGGQLKNDPSAGIFLQNIKVNTLGITSGYGYETHVSVEFDDQATDISEKINQYGQYEENGHYDWGDFVIPALRFSISFSGISLADTYDSYVEFEIDAMGHLRIVYERHDYYVPLIGDLNTKALLPGNVGSLSD